MRLLPALVLLVLLSPSASAAWSAWGSTEPDTSFDAATSWMWAGPNTNPDKLVRPVYFDVIAEVHPTGQNPNVLGLGTAIHTPGESYTALLGTWKDCNHDGYIGMAEGALMEYRTDAYRVLRQHDSLGVLPDAEATCPLGSLWNDGNWYIELVPIGPKADTRSPTNPQYVIPRLLDDPTAQIWGDDGAPDGALPDGSCEVAPLPRGTTASTGALVAYEDCFDGHVQAALLEPLGGAPDQHAPLTLWGDPTAPGGPQRGLLQRDIKDPHPDALLFDCDADPIPVHSPTGHQIIEQQDPTPGHVLTGSLGPEGIAQIVLFGGGDGGPGTFHKEIGDSDGNVGYLAPPAPVVVDPSGSAMDAAAEAEWATVESCGTAPNPVSLYSPGQVIDLAPQPEDDRRGVDPAIGRRQNDHIFDLTQFSMSMQEKATVMDGFTGAGFIGDVLGHDTPQDGGAYPARNVGASGPGWHSLNAGPAREVAITRDSLDPTRAVYRTFYAHVGSAAIASYHLTFPRAQATYGNEWCGGFVSGVHQGWDCASSEWYVTPLASARPQNAYSHRLLGARVGDSYQLRDVDCESSLVAGGCA